MRILNLIQGSPEWHQHRRTAWNASEAPAMMGESPHCTRAELMHRMATGIVPEVDPGTQRRFDAGHQVEALLREHAEKIIGEPLHPFVGVADFDERFSASFDGCTFVGDEAAECKLLNARLRAAFADMETIAPEHRDRGAGKCLPIDYRIQMEQQARIAGATRVLFLTGELRADGTLGDVFSCWYYPEDRLWESIRLGWEQFGADLKNFVAGEAVQPAPVAAPIEALPAVSVRMDGALAVHSNLNVFGDKLREFIAKIPAKPTTDQEFVDCDAACKALKKAEDALDGAEANALGQGQSVETLTRTIADLRSVARTARLAAEKMVKARKEQIRLEEVQRGQKALAEFVAGLNTTIGKPYMPALAHDFAGCISGKKTLDSLRAAVDQHLADKKIEANAIAGRIVINLRTLREQADGYQGLFPDTAQLVLKAEDDCRAVVTARIAEHKAAEEKRLDAERERIRAEEAARADREAQERVAAERRQQEEAARAATPPPTAAPAAPLLTADLTEDHYIRAVQLVRENNRASISLVQRHLAIGYNAAATLLERMERDGIVTHPDAQGVRSVVSAGANVVAMQRPTSAPAPAAPATLTLGAICQRLGFTVTADFVKTLGFEPTPVDKSAKKYTEAQFVQLCDALVSHIGSVSQQQQAA